METVIPVLVARSTQRWFSMARMRTMFRCCAGAPQGPNHSSLEMLAKSCAPLRAKRRTSSGNTDS